MRAVGGILSGHRANEVDNRQDADPTHFVSSVRRLPIAGAAGGYDKALARRALSFLANQRATLTPSRLAKEVSLAVSRKSRMNGASSISVRMAAYSVANRPFSPRRLALT